MSADFSGRSKTLRIGCGSGFWGDSSDAAIELVRRGDLDVLVMEYLAEITMSVMARAKAKSADLGYAVDFVAPFMAAVAGEIAARGTKIVTNAGGVNPQACRQALERLLEAKGIRLKIAVVLGDDVSGVLGRSEVVAMEPGTAVPEKPASANAYLGAAPIARALRQGADIVITGRSVDSALALGPLMAAFDWKETDYDRLACGSLVGHLLECGPQSTGGVYTDWRETAEGWDRIGYPIADVLPDGQFVLSKTPGATGAVTIGTVAEQITYEVHDPAAYMLPDVTCDFSQVRLEQVAQDRVQVTGARGLPPSGFYKASVTHRSGYRCVATMMIVGPDAAEKAQYVGRAILARVSRLLGIHGLPPLTDTSVEVLGAEANYGPHSTAQRSREVVLKVAAASDSEKSLNLFSREVYPAATAMAPGISGFAGGRPNVQPIVRLTSWLVPKHLVNVQVEFDGRLEPVPPPAAIANAPRRTGSATPAKRLGGQLRTVTLGRIAHTRSGDKGDLANVAVIARDARFVDAIEAGVTAEAVQDYFSHLVKGPVERYPWPGLNGFNFVIGAALGGGGTASLRYDPQGKSMGPMLLDLPVQVPASWLEPGGLLEQHEKTALNAQGARQP